MTRRHWWQFWRRKPETGVVLPMSKLYVTPVSGEAAHEAVMAGVEWTGSAGMNDVRYTPYEPKEDPPLQPGARKGVD